MPALAEAYLAGGARFIQIRCKRAASGAFLAVCEEVVARARSSGATVIVNDRADIARLSGADGVHVGLDEAGDNHPAFRVNYLCLVADQLADVGSGPDPSETAVSYGNRLGGWGLAVDRDDFAIDHH